MWRIKFNHVQDLNDARFAASALAEWVGFAIDGPNAIAIEQIQEIIGWCSGPKLILEVHEASIEQIETYINILPVNGIECSNQRLNELKTAFSDLTDWIVMGESEENDSIITHGSDWGHSNHLTCIDLTKRSSKDLLEHRPEGFSLNCEKEVELGKKDLTHWHDLFEDLEIF
jgi:hypothetical protein